MLRVLILGEIIGIPTSRTINRLLQNIIKEKEIDLTIANGDGASDGYGILKNTAYQLNKGGINIVTSGDYVFNKKDVRDLLKAPFFLRPYNLPNSLGGRGSILYHFNDQIKIGVVNMLGRTGFSKIFPTDPFFTVTKAIEKLLDVTPIIIVDFHSGTTSEVQAMQWHLAGKASIVYGSHLRVLTNDYRIIEDKTAVITGVGFCGGKYSVGGLVPEVEIEKIKNGQFHYSKIVSEDVMIQGIIVEIDETTGAATNIELLKRVLEEKESAAVEAGAE